MQYDIAIYNRRSHITVCQFHVKHASCWLWDACPCERDKLILREIWSSYISPISVNAQYLSELLAFLVMNRSYKMVKTMESVCLLHNYCLFMWELLCIREGTAGWRTCSICCSMLVHQKLSGYWWLHYSNMLANHYPLHDTCQFYTRTTCQVPRIGWSDTCAVSNFCLIPDDRFGIS